MKRLRCPRYLSAVMLVESAHQPEDSEAKDNLDHYGLYRLSFKPPRGGGRQLEICCKSPCTPPVPGD
jgi:hypothetical protein